MGFENLVETLNWQVVTNLGGWAFVGSLLWYLVTKYLPRLQDDFTTALKEQAAGFARELEIQRQHDREMVRMLYSRLVEKCPLIDNPADEVGGATRGAQSEER